MFPQIHLCHTYLAYLLNNFAKYFVFVDICLYMQIKNISSMLVVSYDDYSFAYSPEEQDISVFADLLMHVNGSEVEQTFQK